MPWFLFSLLFSEKYVQRANIHCVNKNEMKWFKEKKRKVSNLEHGKKGEKLYLELMSYIIFWQTRCQWLHTHTHWLMDYSFIRCLFFIIMMIKFQIDLNRIDYFRFSFSFFLSCFLSHPGPKTLCGHMIEIHDSYIAIIIIMLTVWSDHCNIDVVVWFTDNCDIKYF
mgnify:CR=1 FL=1